MSEIFRSTTEEAIKTLRHSTFWIIVSGVIIVCFLSGPFGTFEALPSGFRLVYWTLIVLSTGVLSLWVHALIRVQKWSTFLRIFSISAVFGLVVSGVVILLSLLLLPPIERYPGHAHMFTYSFPIATIIFALSVPLSRSRLKPRSSAKAKRPVLLDRLEKYGDAHKILSLSAQDH